MFSYRHLKLIKIYQYWGGIAAPKRRKTMASLQRFVPIKARESVLAVASATVSARQRVSVDWSEASNAIKSISAVPVDILTDEQKKIATDLLVHVHTSEDNNLDSAIVIRQLNAWMNSWLETAQFRNLR